jgi:molybdopterin/thiamine biosynthesis adenylyltransferase/SAM-dependent methyltransferase
VETVERTYDALAPYYDDLTAGHDYEAWTERLEALARDHGLSGRRLLDVACGTGKSFEPFLARGFRVTACDISRQMLGEARRRGGPQVRLLQADLRALPPLGAFDLVLCLDDSLNYVLEPSGLGQAFASVARCLAPDGVFVFDLNTLGAYRSVFASDRFSETNGTVFVWRGESDGNAAPGATAAATVEIFTRHAGSEWSRISSRHVQRHHPPNLVRAQLDPAGLDVLAERGMTPDGRIHDPADELAHTKRLYVVGVPTGRTGKEVRHAEDREARTPDRPRGGDHEGELRSRRSAPAPLASGLPASGPARPRLKATIDILEASDGRIYLFRGGEEDFVIEPQGRPVAELLRALDGSKSAGEVGRSMTSRRGAFGEAEAAAAVAQLWELGLVEDAGHDDALGADLRRYERQLRYFGDVAPPRTSRAGYQQRLRRARVAVLGLGGLGSWAAYALASAGVGRLRLVDGDRVECSNFNRQVLYRESDLGAPKAPAAARSLRAFNSSIQVEHLTRMLESEQDVKAAIEDASFVVDAADQPVHHIERWVNAACFELGIPYVMMSQFPPLVRLGPTYVPGRTGCYACQEAGWRERFPLFDELAEHRSRRPSPAASFGPACGLVGSQVAMDVVHYLSGVSEPATLGMSLTVDLRTMEIEREPVEKRRGCPVC